MCLVTGAQGGAPVAQQAAPAPTRDAAATSTDPTSEVNKLRATLSKRMGVFGNIKTTPLGDASYGAFAKFGG